MMAGGMKAKNDFCAGRFFQAQPLVSDGRASVAADFQMGADAPDIRPPGAAGGRTQRGAFFCLGLVPGVLGGLAQFAVGFMAIVMLTQGFDVLVGLFHFRDFLAGEIGRQAPLPELMFAFDFAFGLRGGGVTEADVVKFERPAQLGEGVRIVGEEEAVVIDVELQRSPVGEEGGGQKIKIGKQQFALVNLGAGEEAAAIVEHVEHGEGDFGVGKPTMRRGVQLPEFADAGALPAAHWSTNALGGNRMGPAIFQGPAAYLGAVEIEGVQTQRFGGGEAVGAGRVASQPFFEEVEHRLRPGLGMVAAGSVGSPETLLLFGACVQVSGGERVETTARDAEFSCRFRDCQGAFPESFEDVADE